MPLFILGIVLGALSGAITYGLTTDGQLAAIVGAITAVLTWLGIATLLIADD
ncbi:hypothetical protein [Streptomyces acidiscabies]|uniref:GlsB/YeaQ/YmgE family stress response membrane protein n=1 Tax=Streptomyces acidiscabies TaxID=42234 RepID=A0ABU4LW21_9ACTN|nr:hypothetical protein [Streptomyces acidiscabies]MDX3019888.1 hypothetical protein [Streptomyces acidiscabies]GAQ52092.1 hypothetical protein a10_01873 [Streptomyces acidiscabies]